MPGKDMPHSASTLPMWAGEPDHGSRPRHRNQISCDERRGKGQAHFRPTALAAALLTGLFGTIAAALAEQPSTTAAFVMPTDFEEWQPDILGQDGAYRFRQIDGNCQITFAQNLGAQAARAAGHEPTHSIDAYIDGVTAQIGDVEREEADTLELASGPDETIPFVSAEISYEGEDEVAYHNMISAEWIDDVELLIIAACPASEWPEGRQLIDAFIDEVTITGVPATEP